MGKPDGTFGLNEQLASAMRAAHEYIFRKGWEEDSPGWIRAQAICSMLTRAIYALPFDEPSAIQTSPPQDGTVDGDGIWWHGVWYPNPPLMHVHAHGRSIEALQPPTSHMHGNRAPVTESTEGGVFCVHCHAPYAAAHKQGCLNV